MGNMKGLTVLCVVLLSGMVDGRHRWWHQTPPPTPPTAAPTAEPTNAPPTNAPPPPAPGAQTYIGCYRDTATRDLDGAEDYGGQYASPALCAQFCFFDAPGAPYTYMGLQYEVECFCGNSYGSYGSAPESECPMLCDKDASSNCGGHWRNSIYAVAEITPTDPPPTPSPPTPAPPTPAPPTPSPPTPSPPTPSPPTPSPPTPAPQTPAPDLMCSAFSCPPNWSPKAGSVACSTTHQLQADVCGGTSIQDGSIGSARCCSHDGADCVTRDAGGSCYGETLTYSQAMDVCALDGRRLCTLAELTQCCGTGCSYDRTHVWVSDVVPVSYCDKETCCDVAPTPAPPTPSPPTPAPPTPSPPTPSPPTPAPPTPSPPTPSPPTPAPPTPSPPTPSPPTPSPPTPSPPTPSPPTPSPPTPAPPTPAPATATPLAPPTDAPPTNAPATNPPATNPPATNAPATNPPATNPPATNPPATNPPATNPPATNPPATNPPATNPPATNPPATNAPATNPPATNPPATSVPTPPPTPAPTSANFRVTTCTGKGSFGSVASFEVFIHMNDGSRTQLANIDHPDEGEVRTFPALASQFASDVEGIEFVTTHPDGWKIQLVELWSGSVWESLVLPHHNEATQHWIDIVDQDNVRAPSKLFFAKKQAPLSPGSNAFDMRATTGAGAGDGSLSTFPVRIHYKNSQHFDVAPFVMPTSVETVAVTNSPYPLTDVDHIEISDTQGVDSWTLASFEVGSAGSFNTWVLPAQSNRYGHVLDKTQANDAAVELRYYLPTLPPPGTVFTVNIRFTTGLLPAQGSTDSFTVTIEDVNGASHSFAATLDGPAVGSTLVATTTTCPFASDAVALVNVVSSGNDDWFIAHTEVELTGGYTTFYLRDFFLSKSRWICGACTGMETNLVFVPAPVTTSVTEPSSVAAGSYTVNIRFTTGSNTLSGSTGTFKIGLHSMHGDYYNAGVVVAPSLGSVTNFVSTTVPFTKSDVGAVYIYHGGDEGWEIASLEVEVSTGNYVAFNVNGHGSHWVDGNDARTMTAVVFTW